MSEGWFYRDPNNRSELLIEHGFIKKDKEYRYILDPKTKKYKPVPGGKLDPKDANEDIREVFVPITGLIRYGPTGYPASERWLRLSWEIYDLSLEEPYFWFLENISQDYSHIDKLEDAFAASENSAFFGVTQQRLGAQQDKISQFLATTGKMIKELFQMVRELRVIKERLGYYDDAEKQLSKPLAERNKGAEITLKGMFVDLVQGGGKSAASVYGMARELEFITLPDLFFDAPPFKSADELEKYVNGMEKDFNRNVLRVLIRHLRQFMEWKNRTYKEHLDRQRFMLAYLRQHFDIIKMYINWVKPYLKNVNRLTMKSKNMDSAELISSFEGSLLDIELLCWNERDYGKKSLNGCLLVTVNYRTHPEMKVVQEGYQRGPVHIGRFEINFRVYGWSDKQVENYKRLKESETIALMGDISSSVQEAMESLGEELELYLKEAKGSLDHEKKLESEASVPEKKKTLMGKMFGDFYTPKKDKGSDEEDVDPVKFAEARKKVVDEAKKGAWQLMRTFKKAHKMVAW